MFLLLPWDDPNGSSNVAFVVVVVVVVAEAAWRMMITRYLAIVIGDRPGSGT